MAWNPISLTNQVDNSEEDDITKQWFTFNLSSNEDTKNSSSTSWDTLSKLTGGGNSNTTAMWNSDAGVAGNIFGSYDDAGKSYTGFASPVFNIAKGAMDSWLALKTLDLSEDTFETNKELAWANYDAQKNATNASLQWLEDSRNAFNGAGSSDLSEYMIS